MKKIKFLTYIFGNGYLKDLSYYQCFCDEKNLYSVKNPFLEMKRKWWIK